MTPEVISVVAGLVSIALGILAIVLSLWFFRQTKDTERNVSNSLTKIETQADMLSKLTGRQLDRLTKFVTEPKPAKSDEQMGELIRIFAQLPQMLLSPTTDGTVPNREQQIALLIALYFYTAQINWWAQNSLPNVDDFDENDAFHNHTKRVIDMSAADFQAAAAELAKCQDHELTALNTYHLLDETKKNWSGVVMTSTEVYIRRAHANDQSGV